MHMVIRAIVYAENKEDALDNARNIFDRLCKRGTFDYFTMFDEVGSCVSGRGRWGDLTPVAKVTSPEGKELVDEGWEATVREFKFAITKIRKALEKFTDEEVMEEKSLKDKEEDCFMVRYRFHQVGQYEGPEIWLYDNDGSGIRTRHHLDNALNKWPDLDHTSKGYEGLDVWIVPADVHH